MSTPHYAITLPRRLAEITCILERHKGKIPFSAVGFEIEFTSTDNWQILFSEQPDMLLRTAEECLEDWLFIKRQWDWIEQTNTPVRICLDRPSDSFSPSRFGHLLHLHSTCFPKTDPRLIELSVECYPNYRELVMRELFVREKICAK